MKILKLSTENIKRVSVVEITPDGSLIVIGGKNGAGKSSVLDSIEMACGGKDSIPGKPIRRGQTKAKIVVDLGDIIVTRTFTETGTAVKVTNRDGAIFPSPQALLDKLYGRLSFDPLAFERMEKDKQLVTLRQLVGLDTEDLDFASQSAYQERTGVNRVVKQLEGQLAGLPHHPDAPGEPISIAALASELEQADATQQALIKATTAYDACVREYANAQAATARDQAALEQLQKQVATLEIRIRNDQDDERGALAGVDAADRHVEAAKTAAIDAAPIRARMAEADGINAKVRSNAARAQTEAELATHRASSTALTTKLETLAREKQARIEAAKFPVIGLGCDDDGVTFDGLPFDQASQALRLRVSVAIGIALNPRLKVLLVREGSSLDSESLQLLAEMAEEAGAQVWLEKVAETREGVSVLIEDGTVKPDMLELTGEVTT